MEVQHFTCVPRQEVESTEKGKGKKPTRALLRQEGVSERQNVPRSWGSGNVYDGQMATVVGPEHLELESNDIEIPAIVQG
jgi:hypothetical protein